MFCFWCHVWWRVLSKRRALAVRKATNTNWRHTGDFRLQQTGSSNSRQIAVTWEGKDARKEGDKRNEKWRHIRRNNDICFSESDLNVVGFVTLRGPKRTILPMVGVWHCVTILVSPDVSEERIAFLFKGWEVQDTPLKTMAWRPFEWSVNTKQQSTKSQTTWTLNSTAAETLIFASNLVNYPVWLSHWCWMLQEQCSGVWRRVVPMGGVPKFHRNVATQIP